MLSPSRIARAIWAITPVLAISSVLMGVSNHSEAGTFYAAPGGSDNNPGTIVAPWKSVRFGVSRLRAGDTLYLRGGTYFESNIRISAMGTRDQPVVIRNYPGETPLIDGSFIEFHRQGNMAWSVHDSARRVYCSKKVFPGAGRPAEVRGKFLENGKLVTLISYPSMNYLVSDNQYYANQYYATGTNDNPQPRYMGPGIAWDPTTNKICIRLLPVSVEATHGIKFGIPLNLDPSQHAIYISAGQTKGFWALPGSQHVIVSGVHLAHHTFDVRGVLVNYTFRNLVSTPGQYSFVLEKGSHDILIDTVVMRHLLPPWLAWTDVKGGEQPGRATRLTGITGEADYYNLEVRHSTFEGVFDGILATGAQHGIRVHHNTFKGVWDDTVQLGSAVYNFEFAYNRVYGAGVSHHGTGSSLKPGRKYIHHNIFDSSRPILWTRFDPDRLRPLPEQGWRNPIPLSSHQESGPGSGDPWKIYNNTFIFGSSITGTIGQTLWLSNESRTPHEVYNNIFSQRLIDVTRYPTPASPHWVTFGRYMRVDTGAEIYDGNIYHRLSTNRAPLFARLKDGTGSVANFSGLREFKVSKQFYATRSYYRNGWESSGLEVDPQLDGNGVPHNLAAWAGGVDLSSRGWPGFDGIYRGAINPGDGSHCTIGSGC
jgi:hypothetical protein